MPNPGDHPPTSDGAAAGGSSDEQRIERSEAGHLADATQEYTESVRAMTLTLQKAVQIMKQDRLLHRSLWTLCRAWVASRLFPDVFDGERAERAPTTQLPPTSALEAMEQQVAAHRRLFLVVEDLIGSANQLLETWTDEREEQQHIRENESNLIAWVAARLRTNQILTVIVSLAVGAALTWLAGQMGIVIQGGATP